MKTQQKMCIINRDRNYVFIRQSRGDKDNNNKIFKTLTSSNNFNMQHLFMNSDFVCCRLQKQIGWLTISSTAINYFPTLPFDFVRVLN